MAEEERPGRDICRAGSLAAVTFTGTDTASTCELHENSGAVVDLVYLPCIVTVWIFIHKSFGEV
jgi:hypothetical protein